MPHTAPASTEARPPRPGRPSDVARRKRRVLIQLAAFAAVTAVLIVIVMVRRDQQSVEQCRREAESVAAALRRDALESRTLPMNLPIPPARRAHFHYNPVNSMFFGGGRPVGLCCCASPHRLLLAPNGRHVVLVADDRVEVRWLSEDEFEAHKAGWKLQPPVIR
ncbi:MAG: hypothetical protein IPM64_02895 [Phycisphaerales bacterium]|nr:hypothetical protein [Phycisphaerales bacterium]